MCLILLAWRMRTEDRLIVAANRDEYHARPAQPAGFWPEAPHILAGRDLQAGGTWLGVARSGRFAAVTNYRGGRDPSATHSRGALVAQFLAGTAPPDAYVAEVAERRGAYSGFNLLVADERELWWLSNRDGAPRRLAPGVYGLGNFLLDTPEVTDAKARFAQTLQPHAPSPETLFRLLDEARIVSPEYGTRCATVLFVGACGRTRFAERAYDAAGAAGDTVYFEFAPRG
ncbi:MAG: NRDE family protein [Burkholderiales bacterium]|nr:NRDE family protein [Burkholderiales bacterium]